MMSFEGERLEQMLLPITTIQLLGKIHEYKGKQSLFERQSPEILEALRDVAMVQSAESSNRMEGIIVSDQRIALLVKEKAQPKDRSEAEVAGYRDVLETIHTSAPYMPLSSSLVLQMHRDLMAIASGTGGKWKVNDNVIKETLPNGEERVRFVPIPAWRTSEAMDELISYFREKRELGYIDDLILIAAFVLDLLCIHPFSDGNGRLARLITLMLLYQAGYEVGRYISLEKVIEESKEQYYDTLERSSIGWHDGQHDLLPWLEYFLSMILRSYQRFEERVGTIVESRRGWKQERIETVVQRMVMDFTISDIETLCPGVGRPTISRVLNKMSHEGIIECVERGRNARWRKI